MFKFQHKYTARDSALLPLFVMAVSLVYSLIFSLVITKVAISNGVDTKEGLIAFTNLPWVNVINMFIGQVLSIVTYFIYSALNGKKAFSASTIKGKFRLFPILMTILITAISVFGFNYLISIIDVGLVALTGEAMVGTAVPQGAGGYIVVIIVFAIVPAIVEEFIYRGVIFNGLKNSYKPWQAILLSSLIFALIHLSVHQFVYQFIMGLILACLVYYTGSILYSIIFHMVNNFLVVTLSYFAPSVFVVNSLSALNIILIVFGALAAIAALVGLFVLLKKLVKKYPTHAEVIEEKSAQEQLIENSKGLSEYEIRQLNPAKIKDKTLLIILTVGLIVLWLFSVLG